ACSLVTFTFIVTIDPVKDISLLGVLIHSLNLQTSQAFNVVFYNQTLMDEETLLARLPVSPTFDYRFYHTEPDRFFGQYPVWDVYEVHQRLLDAGVLNEYVMSLHMEEFFDVDYVENVEKVLAHRAFDILFGNLSGTGMGYGAIEPILATRAAAEFTRYLERRGLARPCHWSFDRHRMFRSRDPRELLRDALHLYLFRFNRTVTPTRRGYRKLAVYMAEDLYFMRRGFAERYNWFLRGHHMYFEDIHICQQDGVCELGKELRRITEFPVYFNRRRIYHLEHRKYYFQLLDDEFTQALRAHDTDDPILNALKMAIAMHRGGTASLQEALQYTRRNAAGTGTQNLNYRYHMEYLREAQNIP
ncbi:MAG TPA: hypothetical protein VMS64_40255, partial [Candidatus Methylomirabilis sp.]|nr:hypothetical protein [Candidatus Methylomirabilis sp.]